MTTQDGQSGKHRDSGIGCVWAVLALNTVLMGSVALSFASGPYSSTEQELWYRYGSFGFLLVGSIFPAIALFAARRSLGLGIITAAMVWLLITLFAFVGFALLSGGGV